MINNKKIAKRYAKAFVNKDSDREKIEILSPPSFSDKI